MQPEFFWFGGLLIINLVMFLVIRRVFEEKNDE